MKHPRLIVLSYSEAAMLLRGPDAHDVKAILAIVGNREFAVEAPEVSKRLVVSFDDLNYLLPGEAPSLPTIDHTRAIIDFANAVRDIDGTVLCHCLAGVSRSTAAALICLAAWTGAGQEPYCVEQLLQVRPSAIPHRDLVRWGDELLGRSGKLLDAWAVRSTRTER